MRIVITGANRGIGLEFTRQYLTRGETVIATTRHPERAPELSALFDAHARTLTIRACDVADDASVQSLANSLSGQPVDILINNAAVIGKMEKLEDLDIDDVVYTFWVNTLGPIRVTRALLPMIRKGSGKK